jgi:RNA polymerase sigma factor for flagellar operon FliA
MSEVDQLWSDYKRTGERRLRDELIVHYSPLVKFVAGRVSAGLPQSIEQSDLASYGMFGLIDAIDKFDPDRSIKFETYAITRIKGAIIDELRSIDWVPRSVRAKARSVDQAFASLEGELGRSPTDTELAARLDLSEDDLQHLLSQIALTGVAALDEVVSSRGSSNGTEEHITLGETIADPGAEQMTFEMEEMKNILTSAVATLGERERIVVTLYYLQSLSLAQIGQVLGVTESRVCQIHTKAVMQLRERMLLRGAEEAA